MNKEELRQEAWKHAVLYFSSYTQGKFFLVFPEGRFSDPLNDANIPNAGWEGNIGSARYQDPYAYADWGDFVKEHGGDPEAVDEMEFIESVASMIAPESFDIQYNVDVDEKDAD